MEPFSFGAFEMLSSCPFLLKQQQWWWLNLARAGLWEECVAKGPKCCRTAEGWVSTQQMTHGWYENITAREPSHSTNNGQPMDLSCTAVGCTPGSALE